MAISPLRNTIIVVFKFSIVLIGIMIDKALEVRGVIISV